jgi:Kdo2-lipid IVA lauroyltransferase/acyltransferase
MANKNKKGFFAINLEYYAARFGIFLGKLVPLSVAYCIIEIIGRLIFWVDAKHRKRTISHILHAGITSDYKRAREIALANFIHLGKVAVEIVKLDQLLKPETVKDHVTFKISEEAGEALNSPNGTIVASAHYGNWEVHGLSISLFFRPLDSIGRNLDNPKLSKYIFKKRNAYGGKGFSKDGVIKKLLLSLRAKRALGILIDQHAGESGIDTMFFSHPAKTHGSPAQLHLKTGAPIVLIVSRRLDNKFHFEMIIRGPFTIVPSGDQNKDIQALMQQVNDEFEKIVAECPEQWLWEHRRWLDIDRREALDFKNYLKRHPEFKG